MVISLLILDDLGLETINNKFPPARECYLVSLRKKKKNIERLMLDK
ncbi:MAG: hypothetical protein LUD29_06840 [Clostridia bacterium]|nr:hypothetical protein [Clostridia bacterium]